MNENAISTLAGLQADLPIPADDLKRKLTIARADQNQHLGVVGDTYTILLSGKDTAGSYSLIDMLVPPGGGPPHHRHDFEESFTVLEGEIEATFRGNKSTVKTGETIHIPSNAPHFFVNTGTKPARLLCIACPAGLDEMFREIGVPVATRTTPPPKPAPAAEDKMKANFGVLLAKYRTEMVEST